MMLCVVSLLSSSCLQLVVATTWMLSGLSLTKLPYQWHWASKPFSRKSDNICRGGQSMSKMLHFYEDYPEFQYHLWSMHHPNRPRRISLLRIANNIGESWPLIATFCGNMSSSARNLFLSNRSFEMKPYNNRIVLAEAIQQYSTSIKAGK